MAAAYGLPEPAVGCSPPQAGRSPVPQHAAETSKPPLAVIHLVYSYAGMCLSSSNGVSAGSRPSVLVGVHMLCRKVQTGS